MKFFNLMICVGVTMTLSSVFANEEQLAFHLDCLQASDDCVAMPDLSGAETSILVKKSPEMTVAQADLNEVFIAKSEFGQDELHLRMQPSAAEKFEQITGGNVGKRLAVVANGKVLIAPTIQTAIPGGNMVLTSGVGKGNQYLDELPWLKKMADEQQAKKEGMSLFSILSFLALGILVVGGSVYFAFLRKRTSL